MGVDEYEVKVHALEDMEEGEVTSDEEGEIKGQLIKLTLIFTILLADSATQNLMMMMMMMKVQ